MAPFAGDVVTREQVVALQQVFDSYEDSFRAKWTYGDLEVLQQKVEALDDMLRALLDTLGVDTRPKRDRG